MLPSNIFPVAYLFLLLIQVITLLIIFSMLRIILRLKMLTVICLSFVATAILSLLFLWFNINAIVYINPVDLREYLTVTFLIAVPFVLILIYILFKKISPSLMQWIGSGQSQCGPEKDRILKMVEDNKITAAEASELLEAMGRSSALRGEEKFSRADSLMLAGVGLVVLGFFLPWIYVNVPIRTLVGQLAGYQSGYHSITGWAVLVVAILSVIPIFVTPKNFLYKISMLQIFLTIIGMVLVLSVMIQAGKQMRIGVIFCIVGFTVNIIASAVKFKELAA